MIITLRFIPLIRVLYLPLLCVSCSVMAADAEDIEFFESKIRPLFEARCIKCHGENKQKGSLRLDSRAGWQEGGDSGKPIVEGKPEESLLIKAISYEDKDLLMPPKDELSAVEKALLKEWIRRGASDPRVMLAVAAKPDANNEWEVEFHKRLNWWSLQPLRHSQPPAVQDAAWSRDPIDRFVRASLDTAGLTPAKSAEPEVQLRRLAFVLTGLPPTPLLREHFLKEWQLNAAEAYENLVDNLLASPQFGEHFARHWMDVVRYTETYGYEWDSAVKGSWEYRDYLIRAFNNDVSYKQMLTEHLAGDLLPEPRIDHAMGINESLIGPLSYHMGLHQAGDSLMLNIVHQEMVDNKINVLGKAFIATTVACARCHDHKFEAVSQRDYYALAAVIMTPSWTTRVVDAPGKNDPSIRTLKELRNDIRRELTVQWLAVANKKGAWSPDVLKPALERNGSERVTIDDVAYPMVRLMEYGEWRKLLGKSENDVDQFWNELALRWRDARAQRLQANAKFQVLADFQDPNLPPDWVVEGDGMTHGFVEDGTPRIALSGKAVVARLLSRGYHTNALSSKLPGALRLPPQHSVPGQIMTVNVAGEEFSGFRKVISNAFLADPLTFFDAAVPEWTSISDVKLTPQVTQVKVEFETASLNPYFPPRIGITSGLPNPDVGHDKRSWFSITGIVTHDKEGTPQDTLEQFASLYEGKPKSLDEAWALVADWLGSAALRWSEGKSTGGDVRVINWLLKHKLLPNHANAGTRLETLLAQYRRVEQSIAYPRVVMSMDERGSLKTSYRLNVRGDADVLGVAVEPDFLRMFAGTNNVAKSSGSGRLELAESLVQTEHPMTSRVYVNRVWQWLFGTGIVDTPSDFGRLGGKPSHPELLDYLAREFMAEGWSTKKLVRRLVLSQTFRQSGIVSELAQERDPGNRLLHHYPTRRLGAEAVRDALLAVSGRLDPQLYGRPIEVSRAAVDSYKRLYSGPIDGLGRRSIYLKISMVEPPKFLLGFNQPDPGMSAGRRDVTNVPAQALIMLNDPLVIALARYWADQLIKIPHASPEDRIRSMFVQAFGRMPEDETEVTRWTAALHDFAGLNDKKLMHNEAAWAELAHAFFNTKELIFYR